MSVSIFTNNSENHSGSKGHVEKPERVTVTMTYLKSHLSPELFPERTTRNISEAEELITLVHGENYLTEIYNKPENCKCTKCHVEHDQEICPGCENDVYYWFPKPDTYMSNKSIEAIKDAVLAIKDGVDNLEKTPYVYLMIRPPGHHCHQKVNGFCLISNAIIAAKYSQTKGFKKIVIVDVDYHHFNGTCAFFDENICGVSMHAYGVFVYPFTGSREESNDYTLNIPLELRTDDDFLTYTDEVYTSIFELQVLPFVGEHQPDLIIVSTGFDAHRDDPIGGMNITNQFFVNATTKLKSLGLPLLFVLEGGYNVDVVKTASLDIVNALLE